MMGITQHTRRMPRFLLAVIMLAAGLAAGLGAIAVASGSAGETYYACVNNSSGTIKMTSEAGTCGQNELRIVWNQQGPKGEPGEPGEPGPPGEPGEGAKSQAHAVTPGNTPIRFASSGTSQHVTTIAQLELPAGNHVIYLDTRFARTSGPDTFPIHDRTVHCRFGPAAPGMDYTFDLNHLVPFREPEHFSTHRTLSLATDTTVSMLCYVPGLNAGEHSGISAQGIRMTAIQIDAIN